MTLYQSMQDLSGARLTEATHVGDLIDYDLLRAANQQGVALPTGGDPDRNCFHGAVVFDPVAGLHRNVCYPDYSAMYPNIMIDINISLETIVGVGEATPVRSDYDLDELRWSYIDPRPVKELSDGETYSDFTDGTYKMVYDPSQSQIRWRDEWCRIQDHLEPIYFVDPSIRQGIIPSRAQTYIDWNKAYSGTMYKATKRTRNGLYGVNGDTNFRLFDWRCAEAVTIAGRMLLEYGGETIIQRLQSAFEEDAVYLAIGDTDGFGIAVDQDATREHVLPRVQSAVSWLNETGMPEYVADQFNVPASETKHEIEVESYAPKLFVPGNPDTGAGTKKTYAQRITWDEGDEVDEINIKGFEAKRSDVADVTETVQTEVLETILTHEPTVAKKRVFETVRAAIDDIQDGTYTLEELGQRGGLSKDPEEYGTPNRTPQPIYRGAKYAQKFIDGEEEFTKPKKYPVSRIDDPDLPKTYEAETAEDGELVDWIAVEDVDNLPDGVVLDRDELVRKVLQQPIKPIIRTLRWEWDEIVHGHEQRGLEMYA